MLGSRGDKMSGVFRATNQASQSYNQMSEMPQVSYLTLDGRYHVCGQDAVYYTDDSGTERFVEAGSCTDLTVDLYLTEDEWACLMPADDGYGPGFIVERFLGSLCESYEETPQDAQEQNMCVNGQETQEHSDMETGKWDFPSLPMHEFSTEIENLTCVMDGQRLWKDEVSIYWSESDLDEELQLLGQTKMDHPNSQNHAAMKGQRLCGDEVSIYWSESDLDEELQLLGQTEMDHLNSPNDAAMKGQRWGDEVSIYWSESDLDEELQLLEKVSMLYGWKKEDIYRLVVEKSTRLSRYDLYHGPVHYARSPSHHLIGSRGDSKERIVLEGEDCPEPSMHPMVQPGHYGKAIGKAAPRKKLLQASMYKIQLLNGSTIVKVCLVCISCSCWLLLMGLPSFCTVVVIGLQKFGKRAGKSRQGQLRW
ncbi:PREDICTED: uncharacterized protein LOC109468475 isoform X2 [Branchiostoma belcheri]|uniref:Uncharacterized protein LOC109468475 isoform X2 n=1 Tax=Branchiostoma belcheri TaxID=7741 RepID=A0A6P4YCY3_BRABE|nr:PREDICTED: uncharacterized protein LOC109468475 isoform X2 [Branchiostoma belcheri]